MRPREKTLFKWALGVDLAYVVSELKQTSGRLYDFNSEYLQGLVDDGEEYVNLSYILEQTISFLQSAYEGLSGALAGQVGQAVGFLQSDMGVYETIPEIARHLIDTHIEEDANRDQLAEENKQLARIVPENQSEIE